MQQEHRPLFIYFPAQCLLCTKAAIYHTLCLLCYIINREQHSCCTSHFFSLMSSAVDYFGSTIGVIAGALYQFTLTLNSLSGDGNILPKVIGTALVLLITYKILQQVWGLLVFLFKVVTIAVVAIVALHAYQIGFDASLEAAKGYATYLYGASIKALKAGEHLVDLLDKYLQSKASETVNEFKKSYNF